MSVIEKGPERLILSPEQNKMLPVLDPEILSIDLLTKSIKGKRLETIHIASIQSDINIVDPGHVSDLKKSIFGSDKSSPLGQLSPILVRATLNENNIVYDAIDGFHRTEAMRGNVDNTDAVVLYGISTEMMYDLRILAANSVKGTRFARIAEWMKKSYEYTTWHKKGLSLIQVFSLAMQDTSGIKLQLTEEEAAELKQWVTDKAQCWTRSIGSIYQDLRIIEMSAPDVVRQVRVGGGGHGEGKGILNPTKLKRMAEALPHEYDLQRELTKIIRENDLVAFETDILAKIIARFKNDHEKVEVILTHPLNAIAVSSIEDIFSDNQYFWEIFMAGMHHELNPLECRELSRLVLELEGEEEKISQLLEDPRAFVKITNTAEIQKEKKKKHTGVLSKSLGQIEDDDSYIKRRTPQSYEEEINILKKTIRRIKGNAGVKADEESWWRTFLDLSLEERKCFELVFDMKFSLNQAAKEMGITPNQFMLYIKSGENKYLLSIQGSLDDMIDRTVYGSLL